MCGDTVPEVWDFAVTFCLRQAARSENLTEHENLKRTFHDTASRCDQTGIPLHSNDFRRTLCRVGRHRTHFGHLDPERLSATSHRTPIDVNLELAGSALLFLTLRVCHSRDALLSLGSDDLWPAWDDLHSDEWVRSGPDSEIKRYPNFHDNDDGTGSVTGPSLSTQLPLPSWQQVNLRSYLVPKLRTGDALSYSGDVGWYADGAFVHLDGLAQAFYPP